MKGSIRRASPLAGRSLREAPLPSGSLVVRVRRNRETMYLTVATVLQPGDLMTVLTQQGNTAAVHALLEGWPHAGMEPDTPDPIHGNGTTSGRSR